MLRSIDISTSGLVAQRQRMNTIAGNIANANTTRDANGEIAPYQRRFVTFEAEARRGKSGSKQGEPAGVQFQVEVDQTTPPRKVHQPGHPDADAEGNVLMPNVNLVKEFVNALEANRAYEANVAAIEMTKEMANQSLRILA